VVRPVVVGLGSVTAHWLVSAMFVKDNFLHIYLILFIISGR
jgi:hypothetical protein